MAEGGPGSVPEPESVPGYRHSVFVRYSEADQQGVVFNSHYLAYCDDAFDRWLRSLGWGFGEHEWDVMLRRAEIDWHGPARYADTLDIDLCVTRWGTTSFDVRYGGTVKGTPVFTCTITYVGVQLGTMEKAPLPAAVRAALGGG